MAFLKAIEQKIHRWVFGWWVRRKAAACGWGLCVNRFSRVSRQTRLGNDVHFNGMFITGTAKVTIGDHFHSGRDCRIMSDQHDYQGTALPYDHQVIGKPVHIGEYVWFGERIIVLPGTTIGEGAIIQAGSVVMGEIPPLGIAGGHPAKVFKYRDADHYYRLKAQKN